MPKPRSSALESATSRRKLVVRKKPYWLKLSPGIGLGYRRNEGPGTWSVRSSDGHGRLWEKRLALADDLEAAAPPHVLTFWDVQKVALALARQQPHAGDEGRPITVAEALDRYQEDLKARGGSIYNAGMPRKHLSTVLLSKPVALLGANELKRWRDSLIGGSLQPSSINRMLKSLRAALSLAARLDPRIQNAAARGIGLQALPDADRDFTSTRWRYLGRGRRRRRGLRSPISSSPAPRLRAYRCLKVPRAARPTARRARPSACRFRSRTHLHCN
jgi:hypothetical protein